MYNTAATLGKWVGLVIIFILFYLLIHVTGMEIGLPIILSLIAGNIVELKFLITAMGEKR